MQHWNNQDAETHNDLLQKIANSSAEIWNRQEEAEIGVTLAISEFLPPSESMW